MNFQQLEYIVAVDQLKNFSKAAEHCHVTQATLSAMIKKLEEELELVLFERKAKPIVTTDCGKEIINEAKKIIHHVHHLKDLASVVKNKIEGHIHLGIIPTIANSLLPKVIAVLIQKYPQLIIEITEMTTPHIIQQLKEGTIDAGILATPLNLSEIEENILYYEALLVYGNVEKHKQYLIPEEIKQHRVWLLEEGHCLRGQFMNLCALREKNKTNHNLRFEANSIETLLNMVDELGGFTLIPELYQQALSKERKLKTSYFKPPIPVREVSLVSFRSFAKYRIVRLLTQEITQIMSKNLLSNQYKNSELDIVKID